MVKDRNLKYLKSFFKNLVILCYNIYITQVPFDNRAI